MTLDEISRWREENRNSLVERTVSRPKEKSGFAPGRPGGVWRTTMMSDPKSFNIIIAETDGDTSAFIAPLYDSLIGYDVITQSWYARAASFSVSVDSDVGTMDVTYTLRDDLWWSFYGSGEKVKITSDDVVFWYDEILCAEDIGSTRYNSQFMEMDDGSFERISIEKIDDRSFVFHIPRIFSEPLLLTNMSFGPAFIYKKAKDEGGAKGVKALFNIGCDPRTIPSMGRYFIAEYIPGQRLVYERNPDYWERDSNGVSVAYPQTRVVRIVGDANTEMMMFRNGELESFVPSPEKVGGLVDGAQNAFDFYGNATGARDGYTVFNSEGALSASFWSFNENPVNKDKPFYRWFCKKEFRQAMSCLLNRDRIISQTYRGLASPKLTFFSEATAFFDKDAVLDYTYDVDRARNLLASCGFSLGDDGILRDEQGVKVEFDLSIQSTGTVVSDIAQIIADECRKAGVTVNVRQVDFQSLIGQLMSKYDWQSVIIGFSGGYFPTQGSNVWLSSGNLHLWNPLQKTPATKWEARVDELFRKASCTVDKDEAFPLWSEYQRIFLEECPLIYLVRPQSFFALQNRWDMENVTFDNVHGAELSHVFIAQ